MFAKSLYQNLTIESLSFLFCNVTFDGFVKKLSVLSLNNLELKQYHSVPLIRPPPPPPPHFVHYIQPKVGGGLIFEYAISLEYKPPPPPQSFTRSLHNGMPFHFIK